MVVVCNPTYIANGVVILYWYKSLVTLEEVNPSELGEIVHHQHRKLHWILHAAKKQGAWVCSGFLTQQEPTWQPCTSHAAAGAEQARGSPGASRPVQPWWHWAGCSPDTLLPAEFWLQQHLPSALGWIWSLLAKNRIFKSKEREKILCEE